MKTIKQKIAIGFGLTLSTIVVFPFHAFGNTNESANFSSQKYLVNGTLYETDSSNDENRLFLHNDNGSLTLYRDGNHWYSDGGEVVPEPYTEPTTIPESIPVTETTTTSSSVQIIDQKINTPESIKDDFTDKQHNSETSALEKEPQSSDESPAKQVINNEKKATEPKKESAAGSEQTSPAATTEKSQVASTERTKESQSIQSETQVFSDKKLLPKTGSSRRQTLFFTISGVILLLLTLILFKKTNRNEASLGGKK
ncbi:hypothetical protein ACR77M_06675 [Enterococcus avium]|uniref:hypothetical protein n=1 Tax=Enterococcus avium TaxID=33945 RepID=UPI003DA68856